MSKGEESTIPAEGIKALSLEDERIFDCDCIMFEPKEKEIEEKKSGNITFSVMEKGADYMIIPAEDNIVEIEGQGNSTYTAGMEDITMEDSEHGGK